MDLVLLYNDRDREEVREVWRTLKSNHPDLTPWFAPENIDMFGDIFIQIMDAVERSDGVVLFAGAHGLGPFQQHIEMTMVRVEQWLRGASFGFLIVQLAPDPPLPRIFGAYPTLFHQMGKSADDIAAEIARMALPPEGDQSR